MLDNGDIYLLVGLGAASVTAAVFYYEASRKLLIGVVKGPNSEETVRVYFQRLLLGADHKVVIHDDGEDSPRSIYNDPSMMEVLRFALDQGLEVHVLFNVGSEKLKIYELDDTFENLVIRRSPTGKPLRHPDIHCKIADEGRMGYLSEHDGGSLNRWFEFRNYSKIVPMGRARYARYVDAFAEDFAAAEPPAATAA